MDDFSNVTDWEKRRGHGINPWGTPENARNSGDWKIPCVTNRFSFLR